MGILSFTPYSPGLINDTPRTYYLTTTDSLGTITTAGYLNRNGRVLEGQNVLPTDIIECYYSLVNGIGTYSRFTVSRSNNVITLTQTGTTIPFVAPTISGDYATFNGSNQIVDSGISAPGLTAGGHILMSPGGFTAGNVVYANDANGTLAQTSYNINNIQYSLLSTQPDPISDYVYNTTVVPASQLTGGSHVLLHIPVSGSYSYVFTQIILNYTASGFSGGGGNRLLSITDGTTVWTGTGITAALLQTPVNTSWGTTGIPFPATTAINTPTSLNIYAQYTGGSVDYTTGSVSITLQLVRTV